VLVLQRQNVESLEKFYHFGTWLGALFLTLLPVVFHGFGNEVFWCSIISRDSLLRVFSFGLPSLGIFFATSFLLLRIYHAINLDLQLLDNRLNKRLKQYYGVFVVFRIPGVLNRLQNAMFPDNPVFFLYLLQVLAISFEGLAHAIVFGLNHQLRKHFGPGLLLDIFKRRQGSVDARQLLSPRELGENISQTVESEKQERGVEVESYHQINGNEDSNYRAEST